MTSANLIGANLRGARLSNACLRNAKFHNLNDAGFHRSNLTGANFSKCRCGWTTFDDVNLSNTLGLEDVDHQGPSTVGIDTIYASRGKIPESFLRGCGVPESLITMIPSLIGALEPIQFYSCFISYSSKDDEFARRLQSRLRDEKLRVWFAPEDLKAGHKVDEQIEEAIRIHDKLLLVISAESIKSDWVKTEIFKALKLERAEGRKILFPVRLVDFDTVREWQMTEPVWKELAREVAEYHIPDFSNWKGHDEFERVMQRLLKNLRQSSA